MRDRIVAFDVARSFAIYGMILVNFWLVLGSPESHWSWLVVIIEGKAAATFVVLAGVGLSLLVSRKAGGQGILLRRAVFLFVLGLLYSPLWPADILHFYGVYLLFGAFLVKVGNGWLLLAYILSMVGFLLLVPIIDYETGWDFDTFTYNDFWTPVGMVRHLFYNGFHPVFPWLSFLVAGIWLGRQDLMDTRVRVRILLIGMSLVIPSFLVSRIGSAMGGDTAYVLGTQPMPPFPFFIFMGTGTAFMVVILCAYATDHFRLGWLAETGRMSLTIYVAHVVIGLGILFAVGILEPDFTFFAVYSTAFFGFLVAFSHYWLKRYRRGPLEFLMRRLAG